MNRVFTALAVLSVFALLADLDGCQAKRTPDASIKRYQLHGTVIGVDPGTHVAIIKGEKIEGWINAMTMEYPVKDTNEFRSLQPQEQISATVFVEDLNYWIGEIRADPLNGDRKHP